MVDVSPEKYGPFEKGQSVEKVNVQKCISGTLQFNIMTDHLLQKLSQVKCVFSVQSQPFCIPPPYSLLALDPAVAPFKVDECKKCSCKKCAAVQ